MDNPRSEKVAVVDEVRERLETATAVVVTEYRGLSVAALSELRRNLRPVNGSYKVYKNTLVRRAAGEDADEQFAELLVGPTALLFAEPEEGSERGDVVGVAKALKEFAAGNPNFIVKGGLFDGSFIDPDGLKKLADIEPREVLLAKLAGAMAAPMTQMAGLLQALPRNFAYGLKALIDQGGADGAPAPAAEAAAEAPVEAAPETETNESPEAEASTEAESE